LTTSVEFGAKVVRNKETGKEVFVPEISVEITEENEVPLLINFVANMSCTEIEGVKVLMETIKECMESPTMKGEVDEDDYVI